MPKMVRKLVAKPFDAAAFSLFGQVLAPAETGRLNLIEELTNGRKTARPRLTIAEASVLGDPFAAVDGERHAFSAQAFMPMDVSRYFINRQHPRPRVPPIRIGPRRSSWTDVSEFSTEPEFGITRSAPSTGPAASPCLPLSTGRRMTKSSWRFPSRSPSRSPTIRH